MPVDLSVFLLVFPSAAPARLFLLLSLSPITHTCSVSAVAAGENPGPEQGDAGSRLPDVPREVGGGDCPHRPGDTGGPPEGYHGPHDCGGGTGGTGCQVERYLPEDRLTCDGCCTPLPTILSLQEIYKDRQKFSEQVFKVASSDLVNMGISVVSYTLKDIHDDQVVEAGLTLEPVIPSLGSGGDGGPKARGSHRSSRLHNDILSQKQPGTVFNPSAPEADGGQPGLQGESGMARAAK